MDAGLTGVLLVVLVAPLWIGTRSATPSETATTAVAGATLSTVRVLALVVRRRHPVLTLTVVSLYRLLQLFVRSDPVAADLALVVAIYSLAADATSRLVHLAGLGPSPSPPSPAVWRPRCCRRGAPPGSPPPRRSPTTDHLRLGRSGCRSGSKKHVVGGAA